MKYFAIWVKTIILINILLMNICRADISLSEIESTLKFEIKTSLNSVTVNPEGPLNFLRGLIYQKMNCMYNKRFFAPQIDTEYILRESLNATSNQLVYGYTRDEQKDKAYKALSDNAMDVYSENYHTHLIDLFPSPTGDIAFETRGNQSFIQFLRAEKVERHALKILAMLLLFSEGVNIPIDVTKSVLNVYETDKKNETYFTAPIKIPWLDPTNNEIKTINQKRVMQMIKFFKENATNHEVLSMMLDKCSQEEVMSGKFLDSPKFLIQSYIFGFIDTAKQAKEFIQTVHTMTEKYAPKTEALSKDDCVYDRLFRPAGIVTDADCIALAKETEQIKSMYKVFPFLDSTELPAYRSVSRYNQKAFSTNRLEDYSNCVECVILSLFCCLAYDPAKGIYRTDHMGNVSEELKEFFSLENQPFDTTKAEFQKEWCRVVADLDEPSIAYCKDRNELYSGLLNMLLVISEIVKAPEDEKKKILGFLEALKKQKKELDCKLCSDVEEYTKTLVKRLSKTKNVEIEFSGLTRDEQNGGGCDVFGNFTISFEHSSIRNSIVLGTTNVHSSIRMQPVILNFKDERVEKMNAVLSGCKNRKTFIENLFLAYIDYEIRKIDTSEKSKEFMKEQVHKTVESNFAEINRLLLVKKISDLEYKRDLVFCSIIYSIDKNLSSVHSIVRFTSNVAGSTELNNRNTQQRILPAISFVGLHSKNGGDPNYPRIQLLEKNYNLDLECIKRYYLVEYVLDCDISIFIRWIKYYIDSFDPYYEQGIYELLVFTETKSIYEYIFRDGSMKYADAVDMAIAQEYPNRKDLIISNLHCVWFMYLISEKEPNVELVKKNFHAIRSINYTPNSFIQDREQNIIQTLNEMKNHLCTDEDSTAKFDEIVRMYETDSIPLL
ncbi:hypothetical protein NEAUS03_0177 [Nematocida ausubeli]|nr:hypothetical protein NEAUS03_0177 [Nematocida ausubeli]